MATTGSKENQPKRDINSVWAHDMFEEHEQIFRAEELKRKNLRPVQMNVQNLDSNVTEEDLHYLFSLIGNVKGVFINCDEYGRSSGTAKIFFQRKVDATEAIFRYNGRCLDGKILKIEIAATMIPTHPKNNISKNIQKKEATEQSLDVAKVVDRFNFLKLE